MLKIGLVPVSAKPYHAGHHHIVKEAARNNDEVMLFASLSDRKRGNEFPICGMAMEEIWREHIVPILPDNVKLVYARVPVRNVYEILGEADTQSSTNIYTIYSDPQDTKSNYSLSYRKKYFPSLYASNQVIFAAEEDPVTFSRGIGSPAVRGEDARAALMNEDRNAFRTCMPVQIDADRVYDILRSANQPLRDYVAAVLKM